MAPPAAQGGPAAAPGWHLCFFRGEAGQASFAQSLVPSATMAMQRNYGFSPGLGLPSSKVSEPEAEVRRGLSASQGDTEVGPAAREAVRAAARPLRPRLPAGPVRGCK